MRCGNDRNILDLLYTKEEDCVGAAEYGRHLGKSDNLDLKVILETYTNIEFDEEMILKLLRRLKVDKASRPDLPCPRGNFTFVPIYKKGSLTSVVCKLMESIISDDLLNHLM